MNEPEARLGWRCTACGADHDEPAPFCNRCGAQQAHTSMARSNVSMSDAFLRLSWTMFGIALFAAAVITTKAFDSDNAEEPLAAKLLVVTSGSLPACVMLVVIGLALILRELEDA